MPKKSSTADDAPKLRNSVTLLILALTLFSLQSAPAQIRPDNSPRDPEYPITFLLEDGAIVLDQILVAVAADLGQSATFEIFSGDATFIDGSRIAASPVQKGNTAIPPFVSGTVGDRSYLRLSINGERALDDIRLVTLPQGVMPKLKMLIQEIGDLGDGATLMIGEQFVIIDTSRIDPVRAEAFDARMFREKSGHDESHHGRKGQRQPLYVPNGEKFYEPDFECQDCSRSMAPPGLVQWETVVDPWAIFQFSIKPDSHSSGLFQAQLPEQAVDGVYNRSWGSLGCYLALKVPDSCTAHVQSINTLYCCCNRFMRLLGFECEWVDPRAFSDWPNCSL